MSPAIIFFSSTQVLARNVNDNFHQMMGGIEGMIFTGGTGEITCLVRRIVS